MRIILIEDSSTDAVIFMRLAEKRGHAVTWSENASGCYETLQSGKFDAAVIDYNLTDSEGAEVAAVVACWVHGNVCFLTGEATLPSQKFPVFVKAGLSEDSHPIWNWLTT